MRSAAALKTSIRDFAMQWDATTEMNKLPDGGIENWWMAAKATAVFFTIALATQLYKWFTPGASPEAAPPYALFIAGFFLLALIVELVVIQMKKRKLRSISHLPGSSIPVDLFYANHTDLKKRFVGQVKETAEANGVTDIKNLVMENHTDHYRLVFTGTKDGATGRYWTDGIDVHNN